MLFWKIVYWNTIYLDDYTLPISPNKMFSLFDIYSMVTWSVVGAYGTLKLWFYLDQWPISK